MPRALLTSLLLLTMPLAAQAVPRMAGFADTVAMLPTALFERVAGRSGAIGPGEAARVARHAYGGRVLAVHEAHGGTVYRVRLLVGGEVRVVLVDARTGRILR